MLLYWNDAWHLNNEQCPCDLHFLNWIEKNNITNKTIFHMGTGAHHIVGKTLATNSSQNVVLGITACPEEYKIYMEQLIDDPIVGKYYKPIFSDIYNLDSRQLPSLDLATVFHLGEFINQILLGEFDPQTDQQAFGLTDRQVLEIIFDKLAVGGYLFLYRTSMGFSKIKTYADELLSDSKLIFVETFNTLNVYQKINQI